LCSASELADHWKQEQARPPAEINAMTDEPTTAGIVWIGKFRPTYPMLWRVLVIAFGTASAIVFVLFALLDALIGAVIINAVLWLIFGASYLLAAWLTHRPQGGPECLFAVTPDGAHYHAGPELRHLGQPAAQLGVAVTGNLQHLLMLKGMESQNDIFVPWADARKIEIVPDIHLVFVSKGWRGPVPLFCTPENFDQVSAYARARAPQAQVVEQPEMPETTA
jgi:hypothetical protein